MNHMLVAELLAEDQRLIEIGESLRAARERGDEKAVHHAETQLLKRNNMRNLIIAEMDRSEWVLYEFQRVQSEFIQNGYISPSL
jgi:hypothetical protein